MTTTLIDIDDMTMREGQHVLGTTTKRDTVNQALAQVVALDARRRDIERLRGRLASGSSTTAHEFPSNSDRRISWTVSG